MSMYQSIEAACLESVIEDDPDRARERLQRYMSDTELIMFRHHVSILLGLTTEEMNRRAGLHESTPAADTVDGIRSHREVSQEGLDLQRRVYEGLSPDTGEINIIRGTG